MCFRIENEKQHSFIALENLLVYKVFEFYNGNLLSPYRGFLYEEDFYYEVDMDTPISDSIDYVKHINVGLHGYFTLPAAKVLEKQYANQLTKDVTIPKGAEFWVNSESREFVTNRLYIGKLENAVRLTFNDVKELEKSYK